MTSESLNGNATTVVSEEARSDRQSAGQLTTAVSTEGDINFEIAGSDCYKDFVRSGMKKNTWEAAVVSTASQLDIDSVLGVITDTGALAGDFTILFEVGDIVKIGGFLDVANEGKYVYITALTATTINFEGKDLADEIGDGDEILTAPEQITIGADDVSFSMEKAFTDLTTPALKTISYTGMMANTMALNFTYGEIANGTFGMSGAGYDTPVVPITDGETINVAETDNPVNASADVSWVIIDNAISDFCVQSVGVELNNNHRNQECMGSLSPKGQTPGTADVSVSMSAYLADENFQYMKNKVDSSPIEIVFFAENADGGIGVKVPEAQLSFPDPSSGGKDQDVVLEMEGVAKAPAAGGSSLIIYWL